MQLNVVGSAIAELILDDLAMTELINADKANDRQANADAEHAQQAQAKETQEMTMRESLADSNVQRVALAFHPPPGLMTSDEYDGMAPLSAPPAKQEMRGTKYYNLSGAETPNTRQNATVLEYTPAMAEGKDASPVPVPTRHTCACCGHTHGPASRYCSKRGYPAGGQPSGGACALCGHINDPMSRFCNECGRPLRGKASGGEASRPSRHGLDLATPNRLGRNEPGAKWREVPISKESDVLHILDNGTHDSSEDMFANMLGADNDGSGISTSSQFP